MVDEVEPRCSLVVESRQMKSHLAPGNHARIRLRFGLAVGRSVAHVF
jgi:hypothetical protein